jgi:ribosomal protein S3AE
VLGALRFRGSNPSTSALGKRCECEANVVVVSGQLHGTRVSESVRDDHDSLPEEHLDVCVVEIKFQYDESHDKVFLRVEQATLAGASPLKNFNSSSISPSSRASSLVAPSS